MQVLDTMLLDINNLNVYFSSGNDTVSAVKNLALQLDHREVLGLVGESGSGKSVTALSIMRLLPGSAQVSGNIFFRPNPSEAPLSLHTLPPEKLRRIRGAALAMIFQEPMSSLNPVFRCGAQVVEAIHLHQGLYGSAAQKQALALLERVKLPDIRRIFRSYPHELSGGQKQRIMIAMALAGNPKLLIADEPTTALDLTVQKGILDLLSDIRQESGMSMLFISHDLGVISEIADRVAVMHQGAVVETGLTGQVLRQAKHPYTRGLIACKPSMQRKLHRLPTVADYLQQNELKARVVSIEETASRRTALYSHSPLLEVEDLSVRYPVKKRFWDAGAEWMNAINGVGFEVYPGETFGLAGESGCGKTTLGRVINQMLTAQKGAIRYRQLHLNTLSQAEFRSIRREIQMVFQDPYSSLNPRMPVGLALLEPLQHYQLFGSDRQRREKVVELLETVGLEADHAKRFPAAFSGGQRQRICLARALALQPKLLICDEIVSALDVSVQATILNLLQDLQDKFGLTYIFISHDLSVIKQMCDRVLVLNKGSVEAAGTPDDLFEKPQNPYLRELLSAFPGKR
ncbi:MAG: ABC transporter ATP-binding protein [Saprospirales bacterium]|nr:ABC transporter ATP-binding protein [Saprospirales bacterium]